MGDLRDILRLKRISGTPVVDGDRLVGIVSIEDFIKCLANGQMGSLVKDKMTRDVKTVYSDEPIVHAISKLEKFGYGRLPVLERKDKRLVGIITKSDIIKGSLKRLEIDYHEEEIHKYRASHIFEDIVADKTTLMFKYNVLSKDFSKAGNCASGLKKTLSRLGIHPQIIRRVAIATYEVEMNIVIFTNGGQIMVYVEPNLIQIEAEDSGPGIEDIDLAMKPGFSTAPEWVREMGFGAGMGLPNIEKCSDEMNIDSKVGKGTNLVIKIHI
jgi:anti-sigma regulatory factor (Ser/Thr protein kinase)